MDIHIINETNLKLLETFLIFNIPKQFRYFNTRTIDVIKNHKLTLLGTVIINNKEIPISYCHIDNENNVNWIGICVLEEYQNKGYGKQLFTYTMNYIKTNNIQNVKLTVDIDNWKALHMYLKNGFKIIELYPKYYELKLINSPLLEVSFGEAIDKLTILDIKKQKIKDDRAIFVEKEYNILFKELENYIINNKYYYNILLDINRNIWEMQDNFRYSHNNNTKNELCLKIIDENDRRFRVKKKINNLYNSELKEQKGYKPKKAFVLTNLGLGDNITSIGAVRYLSTQYDEVYVVCKNRYKQNIEMFYSDDNDIKIVSVESDKDISPNYGFNTEKFNQLTQNMDLYLCGNHLLNKKCHQTNIIPFNFYYDLNIKYEYFWKYFHINTRDESKKLYNIIKDYKIVFIHNKASNGIVFNESKLFNKLGIDINNMIIINPDKIIYDKTHKFYNIAEQFILEPLIYYTDTIINSEYVIVTDSCFFCLSINLPIETNNCYYISRGNHNYDYLYDKKYGYNDGKKSKFSQIII